MHDYNCPCGSCGRREAAWHRTESEAIGAAADAAAAGLTDFIDECIDDGCCTAGFDGDVHDDFHIAALQRAIETATRDLLKISGTERCRRETAQRIALLVASQPELGAVR